MQDRFAGEFSVQQTLSDVADVIPRAFGLDGNAQLLPGGHAHDQR